MTTRVETRNPPSVSLNAEAPNDTHHSAVPADGAASRSRVLIIDDTHAIHEDIRRVLERDVDDGALRALESDLFDGETPEACEPRFEIDSAHQGREGYELVIAALEAGRPYAVAFVDMRMPPGWDGLDTVARIWDVDPNVEIVICTAYSDRSWEEIAAAVRSPDKLLILKKPFDVIEVQQLARALTVKWALRREVEEQLRDLEVLVRDRTADLERANLSLKQEIASRERMEVELRHAQKLEAIGQLAAGIAHEINTPIHYADTSLHFLHEAFVGYRTVRAACWDALQSLSDGPPREAALAAVREAEDAVNMGHLDREVSDAFACTADGIQRVAGIVKAMREFSHPGQRKKVPTSLRKVIENVLVVSKNEYKYVADVVTELAELPAVPCHAGDISHVLLNLIVNASHAIADVVGNSGSRGVISVRLFAREESACVSVADTGTGITEDIRHRVFDPFFTTKEVGRGTGQGLALARSSVVDRHGGRLTFETEMGRGTTFTLELPIPPRSTPEVAA